MIKFTSLDNSEKHNLKEIHYHLKKHHPQTVHKAKKIVGFHYLKLVLFILSILLAYYVFSRPFIFQKIANLNHLGYIGTFIAGFLLSFGFSASFGIGFLLTSQVKNIFLVALIGGFGSMISDIIIFKSIKFSLADDLARLKKIKVVKKIENAVKKNKFLLTKHYLLYIFAGIVLAVPFLPDEMGISMLTGLASINLKKFAIISFILHSLFIFLIIKFS